MKHLKIIGLAAVAAMALMAIAASSASATALYTFNGTSHEMLGPGSIVDFSIKSGTKAKLTNTAQTETLDECSTSTVKGHLTNTGSSTETVKGTVEELTWGTCTVPTTTDEKAHLEVHWIEGTTNGTVTSAAGDNETFGVTINTIFFGVCKYGVSPGTHIGVLTGSTTGTAEMHANAIAQKQTGSEAVCPSTTRWTGTYVSTTPDHLFVEKE